MYIVAVSSLGLLNLAKVFALFENSKNCSTRSHFKTEIKTIYMFYYWVLKK